MQAQPAQALDGSEGTGNEVSSTSRLAGERVRVAVHVRPLLAKDSQLKACVSVEVPVGEDVPQVRVRWQCFLHKFGLCVRTMHTASLKFSRPAHWRRCSVVRLHLQFRMIIFQIHPSCSSAASLSSVFIVHPHSTVPRLIKACSAALPTPHSACVASLRASTSVDGCALLALTLTNMLSSMLQWTQGSTGLTSWSQVSMQRPGVKCASNPFLQVKCGSTSLPFDHAYGGGGPSSSCLFEDCIEPLVDGVMKGLNATVFAYGQTGSGKSFTMGSQCASVETPRGVIPNALKTLFARIDDAKDTDFTMRIGFLELHKVRSAAAPALRRPPHCCLWSCVVRLRACASHLPSSRFTTACSDTHAWRELSCEREQA